MATFLRLCKDVCREAGLPKGEGAIDAVTGQTGELQRIVRWVENSWTEIQNRHPDWRWMRVPFQVDTVADQDTYAPAACTDVLTSSLITRFAEWRIRDPDDPPKLFLKTDGIGAQRWMTYVDWDWFKSIYKIGEQPASDPEFITIDPQNNFVLGPAPSRVFTVDGDYIRSAQTLAANDDIPEMPIQYHALIMYRALEKYGSYESANEVLYRARNEGNRLLRQLEINQLPEMYPGQPMA